VYSYGVSGPGPAALAAACGTLVTIQQHLPPGIKRPRWMSPMYRRQQPAALAPRTHRNHAHLGSQQVTAGHS
jgi:hypothetical protein